MLTVALAGKPNAGKSTFYTAATRSEVDVANYPFTTIDANRGVAHVRTRCPCLDRPQRCDASNCRDGKRYVPVELLDVAGLVPGAHEGRGLGNQFLDRLTDADAVLHVVDASGATDAAGEPVSVGSRDPTDDVDFVAEQLDRWMADVIRRNWEQVERQARSPDFDLEAALTEVLTGLGGTEADVAACLRDQDYPDDPREWAASDHRTLAAAFRERTLPTLLVANKADAAPPDLLESLLATDERTVPATAEGELALQRGVEDGMIEYDPGDESFEVTGEVDTETRERLDRLAETVAEYGGTGVQTALNEAVYGLLDRITVYPVRDETNWTDREGTVLPDAELLPAGSSPRDLAFAIHSDIGEGYLHAVDARANRQVGEDHELDEGDVVKIVSTAR
ncbi:MAG: redox-regulated ATPase YchF [Halobacteriaceae archaeon]